MKATMHKVWAYTTGLWKEVNVLFNDILNTFYLQLYSIRRIIEDYSDSETENLLPLLHGLCFSISTKVSFICTITQTDRIAHGAVAGLNNSTDPPWRIHLTIHLFRSTRKEGRKEMVYLTTHSTHFVTPVVEHWLEWEIAQWVHHEGSIRRPIAPWANALTTELHLAPLSWGSGM